MIEEYRCDSCKKTFIRPQVKLVPFPTGFNIIGQSIMVIDSVSEKIYGASTSAIKETDRCLACPHCEYVHLFGFDRVR
jgi:hypothetical protein